PASTPTPADAPKVEALAAPITITRSIDLSPGDSKWLVWRKREVETRPEPAPFDFAKGREKLTKLKPGYSGPLHNLYIDTVLSRQEAHYWFLVMLTEGKSTSTEIADSISEKDVTGKVELADAISRIQNAKAFNAYLGVRVALNLFDAPDL